MTIKVRFAVKKILKVMCGEHDGTLEWTSDGIEGRASKDN
jgi:hypothetical protein